MSKSIHTWPTKWLEAAAHAGLAIYQGNGRWEFLDDGMRDSLGEFARSIVDHAIAEEREACAKVCEEYDEYDLAVTGRYVMAKAIRARSDAE